MSPNRKLMGLSPKQMRSISVENDYTQKDIQRIKQANYGKWYIKPK